MSAAVHATAAIPARSDVSHVFAQRHVKGRARRVAAAIDPTFLSEVGWDADVLVLSVPAEHPLLGRPVCRAAGCSATASRARICQSCRGRLAEQGLSEDEVELLPTRTGRPRRGPGRCSVTGCAREWVSAPTGLCRTHLDQARTLEIGVSEFVSHPTARPLAACDPCEVAACPRQRRHRDGSYCEAHQIRFRVARRNDAHLDEQRWRLTETAVGMGGQISFRGLDLLVVAEVLLGLQQRCRIDRVKSKDPELRRLCNELRRQQVATLADFVLDLDPDGTFQALCNSVMAHARRALASPESEVAQDEWDLVVFGHSGTLSFSNISQSWLREITKRWAVDDLPKRRSSTYKGGLAVRHHVGCVVRLSESLRMRDDRGEAPAALGRADMEFFLNRLAYLQAEEAITLDARIRACREVRAVLTTARAMGLTRPGGPAGGLGEDFAIYTADVPDKPEPAEPGRDLPPEIMRQVCARLGDLASEVMRTGIELTIDTGRRPEEICALGFGCLARDDDGLAVLVYDNLKANRLGRRLPIAETTAQLITEQKNRVRSRYPHTPVGQLKLLPTDRRNPHGTKPISPYSLSRSHRQWIDRMPPLLTNDGIEFDERKVVLYAYRHTYAQRHADAGVGIDVLRELMDHRKFEATRQYYRVGENRRREAVDRVAAMQFDRHGNRIWRTAQQLLDSEHVRRSVGEVAVPFGVCAEPSNVKAGGNACPYRFRCVGCDHFRTDISYLPDLQVYLDDLLRNRERVIAAVDVDEWAQVEAMPSQEEITRVRRLIARIHAGLDELTDEAQADVEHAVAAVRRHRTGTLGTTRIRQPLPVLPPERSP